jgi:ABC-type Fe3+-hydroxamate transport system substrate-binding protein
MLVPTLGLAASGCTPVGFPRASLPLRTFSDDRGQAVTIRGVPRRVAVLGDWPIELLTSLGLRGALRVAGVGVLATPMWPSFSPVRRLRSLDQASRN